jgi:ammonia channel protein AmtB
MVGIAFTAAVGIFVIGIVTGIVALVSVGIRREEQRFREERRFLEEHGIWGTPGAAGPFMTEQPHDAVSSVGRSLNGLYVRHLFPGTRRDVGQDLRG